ncbi:MAG TPA: hypothetical protein VM182_00125 [Terriglobia bacterium]|nr:hypothetical protein [Terriglobia bacterium]
MKNTSKTATATLEKLRAAAMPAGYFKIEKNGAMMPLWCELINSRAPASGITLELWSIAHWYTQEGDVMRDPDVELLRAQPAVGQPRWFPISFRQDPMIWSVSAELGDDLLPRKFYPRRQRDLCAFVTTWCRNLEHQHGATIKDAADPVPQTVEMFA